MNGGSLHSVPAGGGASTAIRMPDESKKELSYNWPSFLPDGRHFLYVAANSEPGRAEVRIGALDSYDDKSLFASNSRVLYAHPDHLLFVRDGTLMAQPFDSRRLSLTGDSFPVAERIGYFPTSGNAAFSVSANGTLVYRAPPPAVAARLTWFDRSGKELGVVQASGNFQSPQLSPDQSRVVVQRNEATSDIWLIDVVRGTSSRFTFNPSSDTSPVFSADGKQIVYASERNGTLGLYIKAATGLGPEELIQKLQVGRPVPSYWSTDGKVILFHFPAPNTNRDVWALPMTGERKAYPVLNQKFNEDSAQLSPDGRWMLYTSDETGRYEMYVQTFPPSGGKWQVSVDGANYGYWRFDGKEIVFDTPDQKMMAVDVKLGESFEVGVPHRLFDIPELVVTRWAVTADAQRFLLPLATQTGDRPTLTIVLNWTADIKK